MFSFFKKKTDKNVPEWASFFDEKEYSLFINEIDNYFKNLNIQFEIGDGQIHINENEFGFGNLGLMNVAQVCKQEDKKYYKEIIVEHFNSMIRANKFDKEFEKIADNFEEVKKYIGVRLYDNDYVAHVGKELTIGKDFAGDIYSMIVFDFPDSVLSIKPEQTTAWNKSTDELFEVGVSNIKSKYPLTITKEAFGEFSIWFVQGEHFFTPNIVFDIENRKELIGSKGSLVGLPLQKHPLQIKSLYCMSKQKKKLSTVEKEALLTVLKNRFEKNMKRHKGIDWNDVQSRLEAKADKLWSLNEMEKTGGEPDVVAYDKKTGSYIFYDCAAESPKGRRSICYDHQALESRKEHKPANSAVQMAEDMGIDLLTEEQYRALQKLGTFDAKTSSWVQTPPDIRKLGGALFCDFRFGHVFTYHNGAESYYGVRGFRGSFSV